MSGLIPGNENIAAETLYKEIKWRGKTYRIPVEPPKKYSRLKDTTVDAAMDDSDSLFSFALNSGFSKAMSVLENTDGENVLAAYISAAITFPFATAYYFLAGPFIYTTKRQLSKISAPRDVDSIDNRF